MKKSILAATIFTAIVLAPTESFASSVEGSSVLSVGYDQHRSFSRYLAKFYRYQRPGYHYKRGYHGGGHYRPHRYSRRYGSRYSYKYGRRSYR